MSNALATCKLMNQGSDFSKKVSLSKLRLLAKRIYCVFKVGKYGILISRPSWIQAEELTQLVTVAIQLGCFRIYNLKIQPYK